MKKVIVVGAGIAGLSAAIYARRSGFEVTLIEQHSIVGGLCTSWRRNGYLFEGTINFLSGSNPQSELNELWRETGALNEDVSIYHKDVYNSVEWEDQRISLYRDIDKTIQELINFSPIDAVELTKLAKAVKACFAMKFPISDIKGVKSENPRRIKATTMLKMMSSFSKIGRYSKMTCREYLKEFEHPALRQLLYLVPAENVATHLLFTLSSFCTGDGGYPIGGSLPMVKRMQDTFTSLGGKLMLNTRVQKVVLENNCASGVQLEDQTLRADAVIVTVDTIVAVDQLFDTRPKDKWVTRLCEETTPCMSTFVGIGVHTQIPETPHWQHNEPIVIAGEPIDTLAFTNYSGHPGYAPEGGVSLTASFLGDSYAFWKKAKEEGRYETEKDILAKQFERALCKRYPQAEGKIDVIDIATPLTYERYTSSYHGSWMTISGIGDALSYPGYLKDIKGVYFAGQRIMPPGGLPSALETGRRAAQMVCRQFDVIFK